MMRPSLALLLLALAGKLPADTEPIFTHVPLDLERVKAITPLGNLNPRGGHVLPTDHIYLDYGGVKDLPVIAPAAGTVIAIRGQMKSDFKVEVRVNDDFSYYVGHLFVAEGIKEGSTIKAGQEIGRTSGRAWLDLGCYDRNVKLTGLANPKRYPIPTLQAVSPFKQYALPLRRKLYEKVDREGEDKDGKIDFDVPGKLVGNWFLDGLSEQDSGRGDPKTWEKQLAFVPDVHRPKQMRVSIGGTIAPAGLYRPGEKAPDPAMVSKASGPVVFPLSWNEQGKEKRGALLVEMIADDRIRVQFFPGEVQGKLAFTPAAAIYVR